jgi:TPR repeat protein
MKKSSTTDKAQSELRRLLAAGNLIDAGDLNVGLFQVRRLANEGSKDAKILLAHLYETGSLGAQRDVEKALEIYHELLEEKDPVAILRLGQLYLLGENIQQDNDLAFYYYSILANAGDAVAQFVLGDMFRRGLHSEIDLNVAMKWFKSAAEKGHLFAAKNVVALEFEDRPTIASFARVVYLSFTTFLMQMVKPNSWRIARC